MENRVKVRATITVDPYIFERFKKTRNTLSKYGVHLSLSAVTELAAKSVLSVFEPLAKQMESNNLKVDDLDLLQEMITGISDQFRSVLDMDKNNK